MNWHRGYYSLIQYCPDLGRLEAANVGVVLFCPELHFLQARTSRSNRRIIEFFGKGHDWGQIRAFKTGIEDRIRASIEEVKDQASFQRLVDLQANAMRLTPPRPCKVSDKPQQELAALFAELVDDEKWDGRPQRSLKAVLSKKFDKANLDDKLRRDFAVTVPILDRTIQVPFGFQNGRFNLIKPVRFEAESSASSEKTAAQYAIEGRSLYEANDRELGQMKLLVVGQFRPGDRATPQVVERVLKAHHVELYKVSEVSRLIGEIREQGKPIAKKN